MAVQTWPLPSDFIHFVNSVNSEEFSLLLLALERAAVVAMDTEWKPIRSNNTRAFPRVSIMQLACRLVGHDEASSDNETGVSIVLDHSPTQCSFEELEEERCLLDGVILAEDDTEFASLSNVSEEGHTRDSAFESQAQKGHENYMNIDTLDSISEPQTSGKAVKGGEKCLQLSLSRLKVKQEMIFLLDMMALPVNSFWEAMKRMLVSPNVLKLGFKFKQDLVNLAKSFPGPDAHSCFDKVEPYVDIGKLFLRLYGWNGKSFGISLATICEQVVGYTLCKDLQCSDWEQRPLTVEQQVYAAADAHCLLVAHDVIQRDALKGLEYLIDSATTSSNDGIGVLLHDFGSPHSYASCNILHARRGVATIMVRAAGSLGMSLTATLHSDDGSSNLAAHMLFAQKYGERILLGEEMIKKSTKKKSKGRRVKRDLRPAAQDFIGPPPWDPSCRGDGTVRFLCDIMVEGLARQLRNLGFDTVLLPAKKSDPRKMVELAEKERRVFLTQDVKLLQRGLFAPNLAYCVLNNGKKAQLAEVVEKFNLEILEANLLSRCTKCNGEFFPKSLTPEEALASIRGGQIIPEQILETPILFWQCSQCFHMYWQGKQFYRALDAFQTFARKVQASQ